MVIPAFLSPHCFLRLLADRVAFAEASPNGGNRRSTIWSRPSNHRYGTRSANPDDDEDAVAIDVDVEEAAPPTPTPALHRVLWNDESDGLLLNILGYATFISWGMYEAAGTELGGRTGNSVRSRLDHLRKKHKHGAYLTFKSFLFVMTSILLNFQSQAKGAFALE